MQAAATIMRRQIILIRPLSRSPSSSNIPTGKTERSKKQKKQLCRSRAAFVIELVQAELLVELGNAAAGIDQLLLTSEEGVTLRAHFHL